MKKKNLQAIIIIIALITFNACTDKLVEKPFIDPPFPHLSPEYTNFTIDAAKGGLLEYKTGTTITVPENAWIDAEGNTVAGDINVTYREFHEALDIFLSGATMAYDTAGISESLTTAGMFEIRAYKDSSEIFIKQETKLNVKMASYLSDDDFNFYSLNEDEKKWNYEGTAEPEVNKSIAEITDTIKKLESEQAFPFNKNKFFALSADAILDIYFKDNWSQIRKNYQSNAPKRKAETYGLSWYDIQGRDRLYFKGGKFEAYQMVWEKISGKRIPNWAKKEAYIDKLTKVRKDIYYMKIAAGDKSVSIKVNAVMPLKYLFAYSPETWQEKYDAIVKRIEEEQKRLALQCEVYRTFDISVTGFHNWDKIYKYDNRVLVKSDFKFDSQTDELADIDVFYFFDNNKSFIKIRLAATDTLMLVPDSTAKLIAVLSDRKAGIFNSSEYGKIDFNKLKSSNAYTFNMKTFDVNSTDDFMNYLE